MARFAVAGLTDHGVEYLRVVGDPELITMSTLDLTRFLTACALTDRLTSGDFACRHVCVCPRRASPCTAAFDALGAAARLLEMTVAYAGQREQFGAPIGSFQAVKHHCANMEVGSKPGARRCGQPHWRWTTDRPARARKRFRRQLAYAKSAASQVAGTALQVHGGVGLPGNTTCICSAPDQG